MVQSPRTRGEVFFVEIFRVSTSQGSGSLRLVREKFAHHKGRKEVGAKEWRHGVILEKLTEAYG